MSFRLTEAAQLDRTLVALDTVLQEPTVTEHGPEYADNAVGLCCSARFLLYEIYACNEKCEGFPTGQEAEVQRLAIKGLEETTERVYQMAQRIKASVLDDLDSSSVSVRRYSLGCSLFHLCPTPSSKPATEALPLIRYCHCFGFAQTYFNVRKTL